MTAEQIYRQWHEAAKSRNTAALLALYHEAAELESPLVRAARQSRNRPFPRRRHPPPPQRMGALVSQRSIPCQRRPPCVGIPAPNARWRANRHFRADAAQRRPHLAPLHLLGLVRHTDADSIGAIQSLSLRAQRPSLYLPAIHKIKRVFCKVFPSPLHSKAT